MKNKAIKIFLSGVPILLMMGLISLVKNDYVLTVFFAVIILTALLMRRQPKDISIFLFGFFVMILCEYIFVSTGVETFVRNSLFDVMPLWLPFLWGYSFVAIAYALKILY